MANVCVTARECKDREPQDLRGRALGGIGEWADTGRPHEARKGSQGRGEEGD